MTDTQCKAKEYVWELRTNTHILIYICTHRFSHRIQRVANAVKTGKTWRMDGLDSCMHNVTGIQIRAITPATCIIRVASISKRMYNKQQAKPAYMW